MIQRQLCCVLKIRGIDIPADEFTTVFNKFIQSSHTNTHAGGTRLGFAIAKEIIDEHKGKIWVESFIEKGQNFVLSYPDYLEVKKIKLIFFPEKFSYSLSSKWRLK